MIARATMVPVALMPKKLLHDVNARAVAIARIAIGEDDDNIDHRPTEAVARTRERASKGGQGRASTLTPARRSQIAQKAAAARWGKRNSH